MMKSYSSPMPLGMPNDNLIKEGLLMAEADEKCDLAEDYEKLRLRVIDLRQSRGHTQNYLCQQAGIIQSSYVSYEKGIKKIPLSAVFKLCKFYKIPLTEFFDYDN